jgi:CYTH domain-containing protein
VTRNIERERKFLVKDCEFLSEHSGERIAQAYVISNERVEIRVRIGAGTPLITVKSGEPFLAREEFEYELPSLELSTALFDSSELVVLKDRYSIVSSGGVWDIDVFLGRNEGLVIAEIEIDKNQAIVIPEWCGDEVTGEPRYYNRNLAAEPYDSWADW